MEPRPRTPYTYREYALLPEDTRRWELIDGDFFVSPSPGSRHQTVSRRLQYAFMTQLEATGVAEGFRTYSSPTPTWCSPTSSSSATAPS